MKNIKNPPSDVQTAPSLCDFATKVYPSFRRTPFHEAYYRILDRFARGDIRKLMVSVPPQHGKSLGSSVLMPAYMLGLNPNLKVAISSYNQALASRFNRRIQRIIDLDAYSDIFPETKIKPRADRNTYEPQPRPI